MAETLMALGDFRFSVQHTAYQRLKRTQAFRWQAQARMGQPLAFQYLGPGEDQISLSGTLYPHYRGGPQQIDDMRKEAQKGTPLLLVDGLGYVWGLWVVTQLQEEQDYLCANGRPMKQSFQLQLKAYGEDTR